MNTLYHLSVANHSFLVQSKYKFYNDSGCMEKTYPLKNSRNVLIRLQTMEEVEESLDVIRAVAKEEEYLMEADVEPDRVEWTKKQIEENGSNVLFIVALINGKIVGNLDLVRYGKHNKTKHVRYLDMAILDGYRSIGIGSALMDYAIEWTRSKNIVKIVLDVFSTNVRAINLYKKFGFEIEGTNRKAVLIKNKYADIVNMGLFPKPFGND